jgi:hypothetical protein
MKEHGNKPAARPSNFYSKTAKKIHGKKSVVVNIDSDLWFKWITHAITETGSAKSISSQTEKALEEYMANHIKDETL